MNASGSCKHGNGVPHVPFGGYELTCPKCRRRWMVAGCGCEGEDTTELVPFSRPCPCGAKAEGIVPRIVLENTVEVSEIAGPAKPAAATKRA